MIHILKTSELREGMVLSADVYSPMGNKILMQGSRLKKADIDFIIKNRVRSVHVELPDDENEMARVWKTMLGVVLNSAINRVIFLSDEDRDEAARIFVRTVTKSPVAHKYISYMKQMQDYSDTVFSHSVNVALISYMLADWLGFDEDEKDSVLLAGLVHDVGKMMVPLELLESKKQLGKRDFERIKKHAIYGYQMLTGEKFDEKICLVALNHHERYDGSGYPMGSERGSITDYGRLVGIVDAFEAMTAKRAYRGAMSPFLIADIMMKDEYLYDPGYLNVFLYNILNRYVGKDVILNNGKLAEILKINRTNFSKPVVKIDGRQYDLVVPLLGKGVEVQNIILKNDAENHPAKI